MTGTSYSAFAVYFSFQFFPKGDTTAQLLNTAAIFAVGFFMRPIGSLLIGRYADRHGRRAALTLSITIMASGSLIIALTPGYNTIGVLAPIILVLARLLQGLSLGGEYGTSATYLSEMANSGRRGFYSSFQYVTLVAGHAFYSDTTYLQKFMVNTVRLPKEVVSWINFIALLVFVVIQPLTDLLSHRIGRRPLLISFAVLGTLFTVPLFLFMAETKSPIVAFLLMMVGLIIVLHFDQCDRQSGTFPY